ncbi:MAG: hypothetical protein M3179_07485 [Actinomycetota bacterium]|nr:hypothetical protein [Actinomycetota bacterium]
MGSPVVDGPHNLPAAVDTFVGREEELHELGRLVHASRAVTLVGSPGVGKTRLAVEVAHRVRGAYPGGAWLVRLDGIDEPALVPQAVASALSVRERPGGC